MIGVCLFVENVCMYCITYSKYGSNINIYDTLPMCMKKAKPFISPTNCCQRRLTKLKSVYLLCYLLVPYIDSVHFLPILHSFF